jgi:serine phosphatase RsbU (regulator of sigma subunit)
MVLAVADAAFTDEEMSILQTFASQAALAIDTADLYGKEHEVASVLQQSILPEALPIFDEIEVGSVYAPAGGEGDIGGDYYDVFRDATGGIWFSIADVCGKGVLAATKTSMIKYAVRALVAAGLSPAGVIREVNTMAADAGEPSDIVTLWVGRYDPRAETLVWSNGGHPPGILRRHDGTSASLSVTGPLLGAMRGVTYEECLVPLRAGDRILLYTDGVTEARRDKEFFGDARVSKALLGTCAAQDEADGLLARVREFVKGELRDDVAILSVVALGMQDSVPANEWEEA